MLRFVLAFDMVTLAVHVTPKAGKDQVVGLRTAEDGLQEVSVRVTAAPDGGAANKAVCKLIAKELGVAKSCVVIKRGETSRHKLLEIDMQPSALETWTARLDALD